MWSCGASRQPRSEAFNWEGWEAARREPGKGGEKLEKSWKRRDLGFWVTPVMLQHPRIPQDHIWERLGKGGREEKPARRFQIIPAAVFPTKSSFSRARAAAAKGNICASGAAGNALIFQHIPCPARGGEAATEEPPGLLGPGKKKAFPGSASSESHPASLAEDLGGVFQAKSSRDSFSRLRDNPKNPTGDPCRESGGTSGGPHAGVH